MKFSKETKKLVPETAIEYLNRIQSRFYIDNIKQDTVHINYKEFCIIKDEILNPKNRIEKLKKQFMAERADMIEQFLETQKICERAYIESCMDLRRKIKLLEEAIE